MIRYAKKSYKLQRTPEFTIWFEGQTWKEKFQINKRLSNIQDYGHFGDFKPVTDLISELKWENGRRIYYAHDQELDLILLIGGNKNGQNKDIIKANSILKKYSQA